MNVGNKIIALRTEHKMSQSELAFLIDVSRQTVSKWECNICDPEMGRIKQIASIFNVTTDYLKEAIHAYQNKYGNYVELDNYIIQFNYPSIGIIKNI